MVERMKKMNFGLYGLCQWAYLTGVEAFSPLAGLDAWWSVNVLSGEGKVTQTATTFCSWACYFMWTHAMSFPFLIT